MKNHRDYEKLPKIRSAAQFAVGWKSWWISLQPPSRLAHGETWPIARVEPSNAEEWDTVHRGGCNGFFLLILTLAWWLSAVQREEGSLEDVLSAVEDVSWVCRTMCAKTTRSAKRPIPDLENGSAPTGKKPRLV